MLPSSHALARWALVKFVWAQHLPWFRCNDRKWVFVWVGCGWVARLPAQGFVEGQVTSYKWWHILICGDCQFREREGVLSSLIWWNMLMVMMNDNREEDEHKKWGSMDWLTSFCVCDVQFVFPVEPATEIPWGGMEYLDPLISDAALVGCLTCSRKLFHVVTWCAHFCRELSRPWRPSTPYDPCFLKPLSSSNDKFSDYVVPHIYTHVQCDAGRY